MPYYQKKTKKKNEEGWRVDWTKEVKIIYIYIYIYIYIVEGN